MSETVKTPALDIEPAAARAIVEQEIKMWRHTRYQLQVRWRVQNILGRTEVLKQVEAELEDIEKALDEFNLILTEIQA